MLVSEEPLKMSTQAQVPGGQKAEPEPSKAESAAIDKSHLPATNPLTGGRQSFRDIKRQLDESDLQSPGVQRMLLEELERAETQCAILQSYAERFHEADKRAAILTEKLKTQTAMEILFAVGIGVGCAMISYAPSLSLAGWPGRMTMIVGAILVTGAAVGRMTKQ